MAPTQSTRRSASLALTSRLLVGYLLFGLASAAQGATLGQNKAAAECQASQVKASLDKIAGDVSAAAVELYGACSSDFLKAHEINRDLKKTVDEWLGYDLADADVDQIFAGYQLVLLEQKPRPANLSAKLGEECERMDRTYSEFRDTSEQLSEHINTPDLISVSQSDLGRGVLTYALYAQFCSSLFGSHKQ